MDCENYREKLAIDPARVSADMEAHVGECAVCRAYTARAHEAERRIQAALRFDRALVTKKPQNTYTSKRLAWSGMAAALIAGIAAWYGMRVETPTPINVLVAEVAAHWNHEPDSWAVSNVSVSAQQLQDVLGGQASVDFAGIGPVTYANACRVAGKVMSHLVVQSEAGPVMLLLIPEQQVENVLPLDLSAQGLGGSIVPTDGGSIAIIGRGGENFAPVERRIVESIELSI